MSDEAARKKQATAKIAELESQLAQLKQLSAAADNERSKDAARKSAKRALGKNLWLSECQDRKRRLDLEADDEAWLLYYFGADSGMEDPFTYRFTFQQRQMIDAIASAVIHRGDQAIAASRGEGKTTIFERLVLKYTLAGMLKFAVLFAASGALADNSLDSIKTAIEENPLLLADYPEACEPAIALEGAPQRAGTMTFSGKRFDNGEPFEFVRGRFTWCGQEIIFPKVPGAPCARAIIATRGLDGAIRGVKKKGRRVQLAGIDDPDTEDTVRNEEQGSLLEKRIDKGIAGLGDQRRGIARVMLTTLQNRKCISYKFTDPEKKPSWKGKRFRYLIKPPTNKDLWDEYIQIRQRELIEFAKGNSSDEHCRKSHAFYLANFEAMNAGAEVANPNRGDRTELPDGTRVTETALQHYYNEVARTSAEDVATELDNDPPADELEAPTVLTSYHVQHNCRSGLERRMVPEGTIYLTAGGDVRKLGLHYVVVAWNEQAIGVIIDYDFYEFGTEGRKAADSELAILEGLFNWETMMQEHPFFDQAGESVPVDLGLIDAGWKDESWNDQPVQLFCSQVGYSRFLPSKGLPNYRRPHASLRVVLGDNWHFTQVGGRPLVETNPDHWKFKVHEGFLAPDGQPGSLRLFTVRRDGREIRTGHLSYSKHITSESWETRFRPGFKAPRTGWWHSGKPNHWFDATYQALVARSVLGLNVMDAIEPEAVVTPRRASVAAPPAAAQQYPSETDWSRQRDW